MATYTWIGTNGNFAQPHFWEIGGSVTSAIPGTLDVALFDGSASYLVNAGTAFVQSLLIENPNATLAATGWVDVGDTLLNAGRLVIGNGTYAANPSAVAAVLRAVTLANAGTIAIAGSAAATIGGYDAKYHVEHGSYANSGSIAIAAGGTLAIAAAVSTAALGAIAGAGTLELDGEINNAAATLAAIPGGTLAVGGILTGGTLDTTAGSVLVVNGMGYQGFYQATTFDAVSVLGTLAIAGALEIRNGLALLPAGGAAQATIELAQGKLQLGVVYVPASLQFDADQTLQDVDIEAVAASASLITNGTLTLAGNVSIAAAGSIVVAGTGALHSTAGLSLASIATITAAAFSNTGSLVAAPGGQVTIAPQGAVPLLANDGTIAADSGSLTLATDITGSGAIVLDNGGTVTIGAGYATQSFSFGAGGGTLRLDNAGGTVTIAGFAPGATIELVNTPASVTYDNGTIATFVGGTFPLASFVLDGGLPNAQFAVSTDAGDDTFITETVPCFVEGTRLAGPHGEVAVELVRPGDRLRSAFGGVVEVVWVGHRTVEPGLWAEPAEAWPVRIGRGALGPGIPARDLWLSPEHGVWLDGYLVPARLLVDGVGIVQERCERVTYWHVEAAQHDVFLAEGAGCESYLDTGNRADFANGGAVARAHPRFESASEIWRARACAPQRREGPVLAAIRARIAARPGEWPGAGRSGAEGGRGAASQDGAGPVAVLCAATQRRTG